MTNKSQSREVGVGQVTAEFVGENGVVYEEMTKRCALDDSFELHLHISV